MDTVNIGIIGAGNMGSAHLHCIYNNEIQHMKVTAVCDIDTKRLDFVKTKYPGVETFTNADDLMKSGKVTAVIIAVPHPLHAKIGISAFKNGLDVLIEKPADISVANAKKLNDVARESGKVFAIMFNQRTNELYRKARQMVKSGELGDLKRSVWIITNWYRTQHYYNSGSWRATWSGEGGGVLLNQAPHNLDLWQWICGMPISITAYCNTAKYHNIEVEDEATIFTNYKNGATGVFITSTGDYPGTNRLEISGTRGKVILEDGILKFWHLKKDERKVCFDSDENFCNIDYDYSEIKASVPEPAHKGILQNFANAILFGEELISPGYDGINELTISNAAYLSQWKNNIQINIPFDTAEFDLFLHNKQKSSKPIIKNSDTKKDSQYQKRWQVNW